MMNEKIINKTRMPNPFPAAFLALIMLALALIHAVHPFWNAEPASSEKPVLTSEPLVIPVSSDKPELTTVTVDELEAAVKPAASLITSRYYYTNAADFDSVLTFFNTKMKNPFTHSKGYIIYDGIVSLGIETTDITYDINNKAKAIVIHLPRIRILAHEIDDSSVKSDTHESIFNTLDAEYYATLIDGFKKTTEEKILNNREYLSEISRNTEQVILNCLSVLDDIGEYTITFAN